MNDPEKNCNLCTWKESQKPVETGFEYIYEMDNVKTFKKRKQKIKLKKGKV